MLCFELANNIFVERLVESCHCGIAQRWCLRFSKSAAPGSIPSVPIEFSLCCWGLFIDVTQSLESLHMSIEPSSTSSALVLQKRLCFSPFKKDFALRFTGRRKCENQNQNSFYLSLAVSSFRSNKQSLFVSATRWQLHSVWRQRHRLEGMEHQHQPKCLRLTSGGRKFGCSQQ